MLGVAIIQHPQHLIGQGKVGLMKKLKQLNCVEMIAELMMDRNATVEQVGEVEVQLFVTVFNLIH